MRRKHWFKNYKKKTPLHTFLLTIIDSCTIFSQAECVEILKNDAIPPPKNTL